MKGRIESLNFRLDFIRLFCIYPWIVLPKPENVIRPSLGWCDFIIENRTIPGFQLSIVAISVATELTVSPFSYTVFP